MDLKDPKNKETLRTDIESMLHGYHDLFATMVNDDDSYKKAALLYYWLRDYQAYLKNETTFSPNFYPDFRRGSIVNVNLGFNLGAEMGGLHYAVVLRASNRRNPNIVIAPLTSVKQGRNISHLRPTEVYIGEELFYKIQGKYTALKSSIPTEMKLISDTICKGLQEHDETIHRLDDLSHKIDLLEKTMKKLQVLKHGSIVVMNQIRTISKMRISDPTDQYDILYGLKLSSRNLTLIDERLKTLYIKND